MQNVFGGRRAVGAVIARAQRGVVRFDGGGCGLRESDDTEVVPPLEGAALPCSRSARCALRAIFDVLPRTARWLGCQRRGFGLMAESELQRVGGMEDIGRRRPVHQDLHEGFNKPVVVFLTVCTKGKKPILANDEVHTRLRESWLVSDSWLVGRYVLMPDHLHLFCSPAMPESPPLQQWVSYWKSHAARHWPKPGDAPVWQRDFWDTQLRRVESYDEKWRYVVENPVRAGLAARAEDWPYQGEMTVLIW